MYPGCTVSNCSIWFPFRQCPIYVIPHYELFFSSHGLRLRWKFVLWLVSASYSGQTCSAFNFKLVQTCISFYFFFKRKKNSEEITSDGTVRNWCTLMFLFLFFSHRRNHKFDEFLAKVNQCAKFHRNPRPWLIWNLDMEELDMESLMYYVYVEKILKQIFKILWKSSNQVIDCNQAS